MTYPKESMLILIDLTLQGTSITRNLQQSTSILLESQEVPIHIKSPFFLLPLLLFQLHRLTLFH